MRPQSRKVMARAVFLDRDGVINRPVFRDGRAVSPRLLEDFHLFPDVRKACALLVSEGFLLVVATNQPDVERGLLDRQTLNEMHQLMCRLLPIRRVEVSCDAQDSPLAMSRKPNPGMLIHAAEELGVDLSKSYMVGDSWRDVECGRRAGCKTVYIESGHHDRLHSMPDFHARDLLQAAVQIAEDSDCEKREVAAWQPALLR